MILNQLLIEVDTRTGELNQIISDLKKFESSFSDVVSNSFKSTIYIISYNILEYSIVTLIDTMYSTISDYSFHDLKKNLRENILLNFKKCFNEEQNQAKKIVDSLTNINEEINEIGYNFLMKKYDTRMIIYKGSKGGNLSKKTFNELSKCYLFPKLRGSRNCHINNLNNITKIRNKLSHGELSFNEMCRGLTYSQIEEDIFPTINYLRKYILELENYFQNKSYLK